MAKRLQLSAEITPPALEAVTQTIVVYGGKGMGKTNLAAVLCEELAAAGFRFALLDPVGVSWGLRHSADGKGEGLKILILGGRHGDLPIEPTAGAVVADFVVDESENVLVDISSRADGRRWSIGEKIRFVADYLARLMERQGERRRPLMQLIDEAARFAPQTIPHGAVDQARCLGALEVLVEEGRNVGVGVTLITQRSARMAKSVSELAELMIAFRTIGPNSVEAILDWFGEHVEKGRWKALIEQLRKLPRGQALVVSPGWLHYEGVASIRLRQTFDSSKTPTGTEQRLAGRAKKPDLDHYRARMADTIQKAEASDPRKLRAQLEQERTLASKRIAQLEKQHADLQIHAAHLELGVSQQKAKPPAPALTDRDREVLKDFTIRIEEVRMLFHQNLVDLLAGTQNVLVSTQNAVHGSLQEINTNITAETDRARKTIETVLDRASVKRALAHVPTPAIAEPGAPFLRRPGPPMKRDVAPVPPPPSAPRPSVPREASEGGAAVYSRSGDLKRHARAMLTALAQHGKGLTRTQLLILAGYQPSGDTSTAIAAMLECGWIVLSGGFTLAISAVGLDVLGPYEPLPTGAALREHLLDGAGKLNKAERRLLGVWFNAYPHVVGRKQAHEDAGYKQSGDTSTAIAKFLKLGWLEDSGGGGLRAAETFFQ